MLLMIGAAMAGEALVYDLPQGGELLVLPFPEAEGVVAGLVVPQGWASAGMEPYAQAAWESEYDTQSDLLSRALLAPGMFSLDMAPDHSRMTITGASAGPEFTALVDSTINRTAPWWMTWGEDAWESLDLTGAVWTSLTGEASAGGDVTGSEMAAVVARLTRHPERVFFVAGAITPEQALGLANAVLPVVQEGTTGVLAPALQWPDADVVITREGLDATWQVWAWPAVPAGVEVSARLLWAILQQRLQVALREERGLTYGVLAGGVTTGAGGFTHLAVSTEPGSADDARRLVEQALRSLGSHPPSAAELQSARQDLLEGLLDQYDRLGSLALTLSTDRLRSGQWTPMSEQVSAIQVVTVADVQAVAQHWMLEGDSAVVILRAP